VSTLLVLIISGLAGAALLLVFAAAADSPSTIADPADPATAENWLVARAVRFPTLRRVLVHADRRVIGGVAVAVSFVALLTAALFVGWVFSSIDSNRGVARWDQSVADWGPEHASSSTASVMKAVTRLGATNVLIGIMIVIGVIDWARRRQLTSLWFLLTVVLGVALINNGLKLLIMRDRPPVEHLVGSAGSSFPSGHSATAAACWMAIALVAGRWLPRRVRPWLSIVAVGLACLVAASRALLGVHWLTDVVAGLAVGWTWFFVVAVIFGGRLQRFGEPTERLATTPVDASTHMNGARHGI
jgi:undecaprenyl-diphosphatase